MAKSEYKTLLIIEADGVSREQQVTIIPPKPVKAIKVTNVYTDGWMGRAGRQPLSQKQKQRLQTVRVIKANQQ